jgi:hypothetical protein
LYDSEEALLFKAELSTGDIEIDKDNADILLRSLAPLVDATIAHMTDGKIASGPEDDGFLYVIVAEDGDVVCSFCEEPGTVATVPFKIFLTGDLAWYAMLQGKEHSTSHWCWLCDLSHSDWQAVDHAKGNEWTLERIQQIASQLDDDNKREQGIKSPPLLVNIGIDRYIICQLHHRIGLVNGILADTLYTIDYLVEKITPELERARDYQLECYNKVELLYRKHKISRGAQHGGQLEGNQCKMLCAAATDIYNDIRELVNSGIDGLDASDEGKNSLKDYFRKRTTLYEHCLCHLDIVFSRMNYTSVKVAECGGKEAVRAELENSSREFLKAWRALGLSVSLKAHALEDHLLPQFDAFGPLGDCNEEWVERLHQDGKRNLVRGRCYPTHDKKMQAIARWQYIARNPEVEKANSKLNMEAGKRKRATSKSTEESKRQEKEKRRKETQLNLVLSEDAACPSALQFSANLKRQHENNA